MAVQGKFNSIQDPQGDLESVRKSVTTIKENVEILTRQRKPIELGAVTWQDLVDLGLIEASQVPINLAR